MNLRIFVLFAALCVLSACGGSPASAPAANSQQAAQPTAEQATAAPQPTGAPQQAETEPTPMSENSGAPTVLPDDPSAKAIVDLVKGDLAGRAGVDASAITVQSVEAVEWNNSALGCPKKGMAYMQVIVPGFRIVLAAGDKTYDYHTDANQRFVLCENTLPAGRG